jgi:hypothetical protein
MKDAAFFGIAPTTMEPSDAPRVVLTKWSSASHGDKAGVSRLDCDRGGVACDAYRVRLAGSGGAMANHIVSSIGLWMLGPTSCSGSLTRSGVGQPARGALTLGCMALLLHGSVVGPTVHSSSTAMGSQDRSTCGIYEAGLGMSRSG